MDINKWLNALIHPKETFKVEKTNANLRGAIVNAGLAGLIGGLISGTFGYEEVLILLASIVISPIIGIILLLFVSGILYLIARILKGGGDFVTQTYLISLFYAPILVITSIFRVIPLGGVINTLIGFYSLWLLTIALKETHQYNTKKAIFTWLLPYVIIVVIVMVIGIILWQRGAFVR